MATPKRPDHNAEPLTWDHDTNDPKAVTLELTKPFPKEALEVKEGFTYVKYPDMVRRLIRATGNRFSIRLVGQESTSFGKTGKGQDRVLLRAWVELDIPVLGSARTHEGVQIAFVGTGEDMYKGAISDAIKKAAQSYGVGIELTGADAEWSIAQREHQQATPPPEPTPITSANQRDLSALHATAGEQGISHDQIKLWVTEKGYASTKDVPVNDIRSLTKALRDKAQAERFIAKYPSPVEANHG